MKKTFFLFTILLSFTFLISDLSFAYKGRRSSKKKSDDVIRSESGLNIPDWGIAIDSSYDPRLTDLIPGYHIVNIVLTNRRDSPIYLNAAKDKWIVVDSLGKKHSAENHVKEIDKTLWEKMPAELKKKLDYPHVIKPGNYTTIDVFLPKDVDLFNFREVVWKSEHFDKEFNVFTNYEKKLQLDDGKSKPLPQNQRIEKFGADDYLKTRDEVLNPKTPTKWDNQDMPPAPEGMDDSLDDAIIIR